MSEPVVALVAEDYPDYLTQVTDLLEGWDIACVPATDGAEAMSHIESDTTLHLLVTDLEMPRHLGWDVIDAWIARGRSVETAIMVTGEAKRMEVRERCASLGLTLIHKESLIAFFEGAVTNALAHVASHGSRDR